MKLRNLDIFFVLVLFVLGYKALSPRVDCECKIEKAQGSPEVLTVRGIKVVDNEGRVRLVLGEGTHKSRWTTHTDAALTQGLFLHGHDGRPTGALVSETTIGGAELQFAGFGPHQVATIASNSDGDVGFICQKKGVLARIGAYEVSEERNSAGFSLSEVGRSVGASLLAEGPNLDIVKNHKTIWNAVGY